MKKDNFELDVSILPEYVNAIRVTAGEMDIEVDAALLTSDQTFTNTGIRMIFSYELGRQLLIKLAEALVESQDEGSDHSDYDINHTSDYALRNTYQSKVKEMKR